MGVTLWQTDYYYITIIIRTGYVTLSSPRAMFASQVVGALLGVVLAPLSFLLFYATGQVGVEKGPYPTPFADIYRGGLFVCVCSALCVCVGGGTAAAAPFCVCVCRPSRSISKNPLPPPLFDQNQNQKRSDGNPGHRGLWRAA